MTKTYSKSFSDIKKNKFSTEESKNLFFGLLFHMINDKSIFKLNDDIKDYIILVLEKEYKDYLFRSRPYLAARIMNDLRKESAYGDIIKISNKTIDYLKNKNYESADFEVHKEKTGSNYNNLSGWLSLNNKGSDSDK